VRWHLFATETFDLGREVIELDGGFTIGRYSPERSIVDAYRLRHLDRAHAGARKEGASALRRSIHGLVLLGVGTQHHGTRPPRG
jgi:hypothetical protein